MTERPTVSIGMPVYNGEDLLPETLDSILRQTFEDFEVVISDNASTDATPEICRDYAVRDARIRYEPNTTNIGILRNFNRSFRLSRGRYFKWQAHDDLLGPTFLERCVDILERDPSVVLVGTRVALMEPDGSPVAYDPAIGAFVTSYGERIPLPSSTEPLRSVRAVDRLRGVLFNVHGSTHAEFAFGLCRSEALGRTPLLEGYIGSEKVVLAQLSLMGRFEEVPEPLFFRRYRQGRQGGSGGGTWRGRLRVARSFDPSRRIVVFPFARQVRGYLKVIARAEAGAIDKARCAALVLAKIGSVGAGRAARMPARVWKKVALQR